MIVINRVQLVMKDQNQSWKQKTHIMESCKIHWRLKHLEWFLINFAQKFQLLLMKKCQNFISKFHCYDKKGRMKSMMDGIDGATGKMTNSILLHLDR